MNSKGLWTYSDLLPAVKENCRISLGEGGVPLVRSVRLGPRLGFDNLYFKLESLNPSGSYKDRFAACAVSDLLQTDTRFCLATSSGNTGAALAAYCAAAGIKCYLVIVDGAPQGKLQQMQVYGAETLMVKHFGISPDVTAAVFSGLHTLARNHHTQVQISAYRYSPVGMSGVETIAYEIAAALPQEVNAHVFSPAGGGGLTLAIARGFQQWKAHHAQAPFPRIHCVQPAGNNTIAGPLSEGRPEAQAVAQSTTAISGLQVPGVLDGNEVIAACRASGGTGHIVEDELILECQAQLAREEGIFCEPAGAVALAGAINALRLGKVKPADHLVCMVTGHGFKDPDAAGRIAARTGGQYFGSPAETFHYMTSQIQKL